MRVVLGGDRLGGGGEREQRVAALVGRRPGVRAVPLGQHLDGAGRLALDDDRVVALDVELAGLEAQAGVEAGEAVDMAEPADAPLLVDDEQQGDLGEQVGPRAQRAQDAEGQDIAALHVDGARAIEAVGVVGVAFEHAVLVVGDDGVEVAEQKDALGACSAQRARKSGAWSGEEHGTRSVVAPSGSSAPPRWPRPPQRR